MCSRLSFSDAGQGSLRRFTIYMFEVGRLLLYIYIYICDLYVYTYLLYIDIDIHTGVFASHPADIRTWRLALAMAEAQLEPLALHNQAPDEVIMAPWLRGAMCSPGRWQVAARWVLTGTPGWHLGILAISECFVPHSDQDQGQLLNILQKAGIKLNGSN